MNDQLNSLIRTFLKIGGAWIAQKGYVSSTGAEEAVGALLTLAGVVWSALHHAQNPTSNSASKTPGVKLFLIGFTGLFFAGALSGCGTPFKSDKIFAIKERGFGIVVAESPANQTPEIKLGFFSSVIQMIPTSTNNVYAPKYADSFTLGQGLNPFATSIEETTGTGDVGLYFGTNAVSRSIVPVPGAKISAVAPKQ